MLQVVYNTDTIQKPRNCKKINTLLMELVNQPVKFQFVLREILFQERLFKTHLYLGVS